MSHALLLVNPNSRNGQAAELDEAIALLEASGFEINVHLTESEADMLAKIAGYPQQDGIVIIAGGDGTISSALATIKKHQHTLAILPLGTGNDFARSLGISLDIAAATNTIIAGRRQRINLATVNDNYFVNVAHLGLGVDVTHELTPESKKHFGVFAYLGAFFSAIKRNRSFKLKIKADDWQCSVKAIHLAVGNGRYYGGGNIVDDAATIQDGKLSLFCIRPQHWWQLLLLGPSLRNGNLRPAERVICRRAKEIIINTKRPIELEADGEFKTKTPAEFKVIPEAIEVIAGSVPQPTTDKV
ncbi:lipid kinase [Arsukibacterium indicum]|uniref:Lipid kinase n=1 Tax=Arsukibacterium indicum TaxID=2848612 RepID=A0ABS6MQB8_9GAMM|nr:lipid kinase [Arsukibacterium indicum]MBV2130966.1 lipid kinase [Arsukibacterium indicum]